MHLYISIGLFSCVLWSWCFLLILLACNDWNCCGRCTFQVGSAGVAADTIMKKTKTLEDNWIPAWDEEFEFPLTCPELAVIRIEVHEYDMSEKDDFGGQTSLPLSELKKGIRAVPLHDRKGEKYKSVKLLMHFDLV